MSDYNFNLDNIIPYDIKAKYLPVRAMTANLSSWGNVAVIGCNPVKTRSIGDFFDIVENNTTEYFVFPQHYTLYNILVNRVLSMETWMPNQSSYYTIRGLVFGKQRYVHIVYELN
ncbi:MAG: hypothetical protein Q4E32_02460 [Bacteroidales bacterium]|nr:hypothetical protein [Bacteroidales bacterium]